MSSAVAPSMPWSCRYWIPRFGFLLKLWRDERKNKTSTLVSSKQEQKEVNILHTGGVFHRYRRILM